MRRPLGARYSFRSAPLRGAGAGFTCTVIDVPEPAKGEYAIGGGTYGPAAVSRNRAAIYPIRLP